MIGLDTNVLVRYFTQDDPAQSRRASAFTGYSLGMGVSGAAANFFLRTEESVRNLMGLSGLK